MWAPGVSTAVAASLAPSGLPGRHPCMSWSHGPRAGATHGFPSGVPVSFGLWGVPLLTPVGLTAFCPSFCTFPCIYILLYDLGLVSEAVNVWWGPQLCCRSGLSAACSTPGERGPCSYQLLSADLGGTPIAAPHLVSPVRSHHQNHSDLFHSDAVSSSCGCGH